MHSPKKSIKKANLSMRIFNNLALLLILFYSINIVKAQSISSEKNSTILGKLLDQSDAEVMYASIALMKDDSIIVNSAISDMNGDFKIENIEAGIYSLRVDHIEYTTLTTEVLTLNNNESKLIDDIILARHINGLDEVVITYRKPLIEIKADKLIFNVSSSPSASGTNGLDLLKKSPGVNVDMDNNISLLGKSGVQIYINGVESRLSGGDLTNYLQSMTSDNIEAIEIISNPSSKYDAEGNAGIINIRMKKNLAFGFNGSGTSSFTKGKYYRYNNSLLMNYGGEKLRINFDLTQTFNRNLDDFVDTKIQNSTILDLDSDEIKTLNGYNVALGLEYQISKKHLVNLSGRSVFNENENILQSQTDIFEKDPKELASVLISEAVVDLPSQNHNINANHIWQIDNNSSLNTALSFGLFNNDKNTEQPNTFYEKDETTVRLIDNSEFDAETEISLLSSKTDYTKEWDDVSFGTGLKYSYINTGNNFNFYDFIEDEPLLNLDKSNDFNYEEKVAALYATLNVKLSETIKFDAGIRIENTDSRGQLLSSLSIENKDVSRNYTDYFPSIGLSFANKSDHSWSINAGRRVARPNYQDLNPFETPLSQLTVWKGNPFLSPSYTMNYQVSYAYKSKLIVTNSYSVTTDFFANIFEVTGETSNQIIPRNMEKATNYGVSISYPLEVNKKWSLVGFATGSYKKFNGDLEGTVIDISAKTWDFRIQNNIKLPWDIYLDLTYFVESDWIWRGSIDVRGNHDLSFGLKKSFMDKRFQIRITGADILRTTNDYFYNGNYGGILIDGVRSFDSQRFGMGITFKFGNQKAKTSRKGESALDDELNRISN